LQALDGQCISRTRRFVEFRRMSLRRLSLAAPLAAIALAGCGVNAIPTAEETTKAKWADVQNQYQRRADLIPNLVATVKGYATHEQSTLEGVTAARAKATSITLSPVDLEDPAKMKAFQDAQNGLSGALGKLLSVQEAYPDLKADQNFLALQSQLEGTENRIAVARSDYNGSVQAYNTMIRTFPAAITAKLVYGAKPITPFQATAPNAENAPKVSF
jgi:LemA protein